VDPGLAGRGTTRWPATGVGQSIRNLGSVREPSAGDRCRNGMRVKVLSKTAVGVGVMLLVATAAFPGPVVAKGIESASIHGPGLAQPIELGPGRGWALIELADLVAMWAVTPGYPEPVTLLERTPAVRLGPSYTLTWQVFSGPEETTPIVQELYPYPEGGPLVYTMAGQQIFDDVTAGGWYQARTALPELLLRLGMPSPTTLDNAAGSGDCGVAG
jgi:hypothetical protein